MPRSSTPGKGPPSTRGRRPGRPEAPPPTIDRAPEETLAGVNTLNEVRGPLGVLLWQTARDVVLWASTPPSERIALFNDRSVARRRRELQATPLDVALRSHLATLATLLAPSATQAPGEIAKACMGVTKWARAHGLPSTAATYAQAASLLSPADPEPTLAVAEITAATTQTSRAETWTRRTIILARRAYNSAAYASAYMLLADLCVRRNDLANAYIHLLRALRSTRRYGPRLLRRDTLLELASISLALGRLDDAHSYAEEAHRMVRVGRSPPLAFVLTRPRIWITRGEPYRALAALQSALATRTDPTEAAAIQALIALSAAATGDSATYDRTWDEASRVLGPAVPTRAVVDALLDLARAAALAGDPTRLSTAAAAAAVVSRENAFVAAAVASLRT